MVMNQQELNEKFLETIKSTGDMQHETNNEVLSVLQAMSENLDQLSVHLLNLEARVVELEDVTKEVE